MRAVQYLGPGQPFELRDVPSVEPGPGQVRIAIKAAGMCHTELHFQSGLLNLGKAPVTMGHEIAGEIDAVGEGVDPARLGERVVVYYYDGCGQCEWCERGEENLCPQVRTQYGFFHDGGYAESVVVPSRNAVQLPDSLSYEEAAPIACGVTTAVHAMEIGQVKAGETVVVYGVGAVGYGLIQVAKVRGARVIAVGRKASKLEKARELGADVAIAGGDGVDVASAVREATGGRGADVVFELVATKETMPHSTNMLAKRGRLVFIGYSEDPYQVHPIQLVIQEASAVGSVGNTLDELNEALQLVASGQVKTEVDRVLPLEEFQAGIEALEQGEVIGRIVLRP